MAVELITQAEYARRRGVSEAAVSKAVKAGRITLIDGKIDPAVADVQWEANTRKAVGRGGAPATAAPSRLRAAQTRSYALADDHDGEHDDDPPAPGGHFDYEGSRAKREHHEATMAEAKALAFLGRLVETAKVRTAVADIGRVVADHLERIPDRVSAQITPAMSLADIHARIEAELTHLRADLAAAVMELPRKLGTAVES